MGQALQAQAEAAAQSPSSGFPRLGPEGCQRFLAIALKQPPLGRGRFDALVSDVAGIAAGEETLDALLAYEMPSLSSCT